MKLVADLIHRFVRCLKRGLFDIVSIIDCADAQIVSGRGESKEGVMRVREEL